MYILKKTEHGYFLLNVLFLMLSYYIGYQRARYLFVTSLSVLTQLTLYLSWHVEYTTALT